eukprot:CAMPEP_0185915088 /NCGR_PEP_ID=MMETSP0924C-20121207/2000_1 /TAXON_ID=321610 /ORGANISM="Perkinsus chesapeaki, Strain ATCC PRA-65" /LENGTH=47 /DNA_ID= /DNA_START= /DNA_END= /DNA_ORIENTATION=
MASTVSSSSTSVSLATFTELKALTTKGPLVDLALFGPREGQTIALEL